MARGGFGEINAIGEGRSVGENMGSGYGGNNGRGPVDNVYPTGIVADGNELSARGGENRGIRRDTSVARNQSKMRGMSERK